MSEPAILGKIRETLEASLASREAALVLFDALASWGPRVPAEAEELASFVAGPLTDAITMRLDPVRARDVLRALDVVLETVTAPTQDHEIPVVWDEEETHHLPTVERAVPVLVVAGHGGLAAMLGTALGPDRVEARAESAPARLDRALAGPPAVVIVDASDPLALPPDELHARLSRLPTSTTVVIWGSDVVYGARLAELADHAGRAVAALRIADGVESVLDLVLARRAGPAREDR